jgi:ADP-ribose pyrophosphatase
MPSRSIHPPARWSRKKLRTAGEPITAIVSLRNQRITVCDANGWILRAPVSGPRRVGLEFPGGHLEPDEAPQDGARRELLEETGFESDAWTYLGGYMVNSNQGGAVSHMFRATGCHRTATPRSDDLEETEIMLLSRDELLAAIGRGEIHLLTQIALVSMVWQKDIANVLTGKRWPVLQG